MKNKMLSCPFCGRWLNTQQGINSHIQQTRCNTRPGLVSLSSFISDMPSHTSNNPTPSTNQDSPQPFGSEHCEDHREDLHEDVGVEGYFEPGSLDTGLSEPAVEGPYTVEYQGAARVVGYGKTALDLFNEDRFSDHRRLNLYYPWASKGEWEVAQYLLKSSLSLADIDEFLKLELVCSYVSLA